MNYKWVILSKFGCFENFELNKPSCRVFCGLSEYLKIIQIRCTEHKLWTFKVSRTPLSQHATCTYIYWLYAVYIYIVPVVLARRLIVSP